MSVGKAKYRLFAVGALGTFMSTFEGAIVNVALPGITVDLNCSIDAVAWVVLAYTVTLISLMLIFGALIQRTGYGFGYKLGYILFVLGSLLCGLSSTIEWLIVGRVIQATGTAMFAAVGPAMVSDVFPENERGKGIGMMVMCVSAGFMVGPPVGGFLLSIWKWQAIFLVGIPIGIVGLVMAGKFFKHEPFKKATRPLPLLSASLMSAALVMMTFGLSRVGDLPLTDIQLWGTGGLGFLLLIGFLLVERDPKKALIGLAIFRNRRFVTSVLAQQAHFIPFAGVMILMPFYLEQIKGLTPQEVGFYLVVLPICMFVAAPLSGKLSDKIGVRIPTVAGAVAIVAGLYLLLGFEPDTDAEDIIMTLIVLGVGVGLFSSPNSAAFMSSVTAEQRGVTSAILATGRNIGMTIGIALSTALFDYFLTAGSGSPEYVPAFMVSYHKVIWVGIGIAVAGVLICLTRDD